MKLYHVTRRRNLDGILKDGLIPAAGYGFTTKHNKYESVSFFETRVIPPQPGNYVILRIDTEKTDAFFWKLSDFVPHHGTPDFGYDVPGDWRVTGDRIPPQAIEAIANPPKTDAIHLVTFVRGASKAKAALRLLDVLIDPVSARAWRSVRLFENRTRHCPWESDIDLANEIEWVFSKRSRLDVFYDALEDTIKQLYKQLGSDPDWQAVWRDYNKWFNAGRKAASAALAYKDVAA